MIGKIHAVVIMDYKSEGMNYVCIESIDRNSDKIGI